MTLYQVLEQHNLFIRKTEIVKNLGDGFLYHANSIYRDIRERTRKINYTFSIEPNSHFIALPFAQLENIFKTKKIPMIDNTSVLEAIPLDLQKVIQWQEIEIGYRKNYIFHESCHAVARDILIKTKTDVKIISLLLEESFANACELFGMIQAKTSVHQVFYSANSYSIAFEDNFDIEKIIKSLGFDHCFKFAVLAYLHSNFLYSQFSTKNLKFVTDFIFKRDLNKKEMQQILFLSQMAFSLDEEFKNVTRSLHFKLNHYIEADFVQLRNEYLNKSFLDGFLFSQLANILDSMVEVFYT